MAHPNQRSGLFTGSRSTAIARPRGRVVGTYSPEPDGVSLERQLECPPAAGVFTPEELEARIDYYAARARAGLPLFVPNRKAGAA